MPSLHETLRAGLPCIGSWMQLPDPSVAEIMGAGGFDWVAVDLEHGSIGVNDLPNLFRALELHGTAPFVRLAHGEAKEIKQALDAGARGLIIPMVEDAAQLRRAISWARFPPLGQRGVGYSRANLFGKRFPTYFERINRELVIVAQIESIGAIRNLDEIASVPGLDAFIIGPYDLSASMGITGQFNHPEFSRAIAEYEAVARRRKIPLGLHVVQPDAAQLEEKIRTGYQFIAYGIDAVFLYHQARNPHARG